jgi:hypothetical protein
MEPLTPNDPLWNLLGKARHAEPRPDFVQNVVRAARQTPQDLGWLAGIRAWWHQRDSAAAGLAWAAAAVITLLGISLVGTPSAETTAAPQAAVRSAVQEPVLNVDDFLVPEFETEWKNLETMGDLLVVHDTSQFTDREIQLLLY